MTLYRRLIRLAVALGLGLMLHAGWPVVAASRAPTAATPERAVALSDKGQAEARPDVATLFGSLDDPEVAADARADDEQSFDLGEGYTTDQGSSSTDPAVPQSQPRAGDEPAGGGAQPINTSHAPVDPEAYGYASEQALIAEVRARFQIPEDYRVSVYEHEVEGERMIAVGVSSLDTMP